MADFEGALTSARSVTTHVYGPERGGQVHCQQGANLVWHEDFFEWIAERFPTSSGFDEHDVVSESATEPSETGG